MNIILQGMVSGLIHSCILCFSIPIIPTCCRDGEQVDRSHEDEELHHNVCVYKHIITVIRLEMLITKYLLDFIQCITYAQSLADTIAVRIYQKLNE